MSEYLLAFDLGTTANKAVLVDAATGKVAGAASAPYSTRYGDDGAAEQRPDDWWQSAVTACRRLSDRFPDAFGHVIAIGCGGIMNGLVAVDSAGAAVCDSIIHADVRSAPQARRLESQFGLDAIYERTLNRPDCHLTLPKSMWLAENRPDLLARTEFIVQANDFLASRLTGVFGVTDPSCASLTGGFDPVGRTWLTDLWKSAGVDPGKLPEVRPSTQILGQVTAAAARATGLTAGTPVVVGGGDGACASAGSGVATGEAYNYLGGTSWIGLITQTPVRDTRLSSFCCLDERLTSFGTVQSAGSSVEWIGRLIGPTFPAPPPRGLGTSPEGEEPSADDSLPPGAQLREVDAQRREGLFIGLDEIAAAVPPGSRRLFFLPYLQGERAPLWDDRARGVFFGLATEHGKAEVFRAVLEGVAYALKSIADIFADAGRPLAGLRVLGGGSSSALWLEILSAVYDFPLSVVEDQDSATALGAAMAAGVGVGCWSSIAQAAKTVKVARVVVPDPVLSPAYGPLAELFATLYPALAERFAALASLSKGG